jgi:hypothetical protein
MTVNPHNHDLSTATAAPPCNMLNHSVMSSILLSNDTIMKDCIMMSNTCITKRLSHPSNVLLTLMPRFNLVQDCMFDVSMVMRMLTGILQMEGKAKDMIHNNEHQHIHILPPRYTPMKWLNMLIIIIINSFWHTAVAHLSMVKTFLIITRPLESARLLLSILQRSENFIMLMITLLTR